jgi:hypothetical protein
MNRSLRIAIGGSVTAMVLTLARVALAEVRSSTLGIDINCPSGLSE